MQSRRRDRHQPPTDPSGLCGNQVAPGNPRSRRERPIRPPLRAPASRRGGRASEGEPTEVDSDAAPAGRRSEWPCAFGMGLAPAPRILIRQARDRERIIAQDGSRRRESGALLAFAEVDLGPAEKATVAREGLAKDHAAGRVAAIVVIDVAVEEVPAGLGDEDRAAAEPVAARSMASIDRRNVVAGAGRRPAKRSAAARRASARCRPARAWRPEGAAEAAAGLRRDARAGRAVAARS